MRLAKALHGVPATSMPSQRTFSCVGATHTKGRACLGQHMIDDLTLLEANPIKRKDMDDFMDDVKSYCNGLTSFIA